MNVHNLDSWDEPRPRSWRWLWIVLVFAVVAAAGGVIYWLWRAHEFDDVTASAGRLTLEVDKGENLKVIDRRAGHEVWYRVTLDNVAEGAVVPLLCEWIDPTGHVSHKNKYDTRPITHQAWETHARYRFGAHAKVGAWRVRLLVRDRMLHEMTFDVRDGE